MKYWKVTYKKVVENKKLDEKDWRVLRSLIVR